MARPQARLPATETATAPARPVPVLVPVQVLVLVVALVQEGAHLCRLPLQPLLAMLAPPRFAVGILWTDMQWSCREVCAGHTVRDA